MVPPTEADIDQSCVPGGWPTWRDFRAAYKYGESISDAQEWRCWRESWNEVPGAQISQWVRFEIPKVGGRAEESVGAFEKLDDCETAQYVARKADVGSRGPGTRFVPTKPFFDKYGNDPAFKDINGDQQMLQALENFKREHPSDDQASTYAAMMEHLFAPHQEGERAATCVASDDPRLKGEK
jgi:hypothetical protein